MNREHVHFVTGRLAAESLHNVLADLAPRVDFDYSVGVLGISVAALMTPRWVAQRLTLPVGTTRLVVPGYCLGELGELQAAAGVPVDRGPKDLRDLPQWFNAGDAARQDYGRYSIEILAEINHAPRLSSEELLRQARALAAEGADVIDLGCNPGDDWTGVADAVRMLRDASLRVSIHSMNVDEVERAVRAGAELVLSVNSTNVERAADWGCEVVVVPDVAESLAGLDDTVARLQADGVPLRIDPILEPIGFGFARSLGRYLDVRRRYPNTPMMMGIGNLTELTDVDSAGVNALLLGFCQEQRIDSVLTTQVINWARSSVRECDVARRLAFHAVEKRVLPKHVDNRLVMLRDTRVHERGAAELDRLAREIKDPNYRIFVDEGQLHVISAGMHLQGTDPYALLARVQSESRRPLTASHAFYLGYELAKARTALTLGKDYRQDEALNWGFLTVAEDSHAGRRQLAAEEPLPEGLGPEQHSSAD
jgi:dihydropteroate synthase